MLQVMYFKDFVETIIHYSGKNKTTPSLYFLIVYTGDIVKISKVIHEER